MTQKALLIGIVYSGQEGELRGCINDILNVRKFIKTQGFQPHEIKIMTEASSDESLIPTAENIMRELAWLCEGVTSESNLFLQYSGHGGSLKDRGKDEVDGADETICPLDYDTAGQITDDMLRQHLIDKLPAGCQLMALFDSCHSGSVLDLKYNWTGHATRPGAYNLLVDTYAETKAQVICLSGCRDEQTSADAEENDQNQGAMTYGLLYVLELHKKKSEKVTCKTLIRDINILLKSKKYTQSPQLSCGRRMDLDDEFSIRKVSTSTREPGI